MMKVPLSGPSITELEKRYVMDVLQSGVLSMGKYTTEFESRISEYANRKYALAVSSGTAALFLALRYYNLTNRDEIITTPFSFVASANVILHSGASIVFVDIDRNTMCISAILIEKYIKENYVYSGKQLINRHNKKILKGLLIVDLFGSMPDYKKILEIANQYGLFLIEDSCEALGSEYNNRKAGNMGDISAFAFYPNKQITTGEGGVLLTDNKDIFDFVKAMRNQGRRDMDLWLEHYYIGYNFRIDEMSSALGLAQMERINDILNKREEKANYYIKAFEGFDGVKCFKGNIYGKTGWFVFIIQVDKNIRSQLMEFLINNGIGVRPYFTPIHLQRPYREKFNYKNGDYKITEDISKTTIAIPFFSDIKKEQQDYVIKTIKDFFYDKG